MIQEFFGGQNAATHVKETIEYELPLTEKIANMFNREQTNREVKKALKTRSFQMAKHRIESSAPAIAQ